MQLLANNFGGCIGGITLAGRYAGLQDAGRSLQPVSLETETQLLRQAFGTVALGLAREHRIEHHRVPGP